MADSNFDPSLYSRLPLLPLTALVVLARTLIGVAPKNLPPLVQRVLGKLERLTKTAEAALAARQRALGTASTSGQEIDTLADRAVGALRMRLEACAMLPEDAHPLAPRAQELLSLMFPEGLGFLKLPYVEQLAEMRTLLSRIDDESLNKDIDTICGPEFLKNLRTIVPRYRVMVETSLKQQDSSENLQEHRRVLAASITDYASKVAAQVDEDDPKSLERVRAALRPIDAVREQFGRRSTSTEPPPKPPMSEPPPTGQ